MRRRIDANTRGLFQTTTFMTSLLTADLSQSDSIGQWQDMRTDPILCRDVLTAECRRDHHRTDSMTTATPEISTTAVPPGNTSLLTA